MEASLVAAKIDEYLTCHWEDVVADIDTLVRIPSIEDLSQAAENAPFGQARANRFLLRLPWRTPWALTPTTQKAISDTPICRVSRRVRLALSDTPMSFRQVLAGRLNPTR